MTNNYSIHFQICAAHYASEIYAKQNALLNTRKYYSVNLGYLML